jgi:small subunit ribosomal protein S13
LARIAGVDLPKNKRVVVGLTYIYGIGRSSAEKICAEANVDENTRVSQLTEEEVKRIRTLIQNDYKHEHQAPDGYQFGKRVSSSPRFAGTWSTH